MPGTALGTVDAVVKRTKFSAVKVLKLVFVVGWGTGKTT